MTRIRYGRKMTAAAEIVRANPGVTKMFVADLVGANGSRRYGYAVVDRAIKAQMIRARLCGNHYQLFPGDWGTDSVSL